MKKNILYAMVTSMERKNDIYPDDLPNWSAVAVADENGNENEKA